MRKLLPVVAALLLLTQAAPARADRVSFVKHPDQAFAAFLSVIEGAKKTLDLTTFIFEPCHVSTRVLMDAMEARAKAGVHVRVLLDSFQQSEAQKAELSRWFTDRGIELRWYNERGGLDVNFRTHAKFLIADGARYIAGGRNWADDYFGLYRGINFADRDLLVDGSATRQAEAAFEELWNSRPAVVPTSFSAPFRRWEEVCRAENGGADDAGPRVAQAKKFLAANKAKILAALPARSCSDVRFTVDSPYFTDPGLTGGLDPRWDNYMGSARLRYKRTTKTMLDFMNATTKGLELENWSYIPVNFVQKAFDDLRARRTPVHVITNADMDGPGVIKYAEEYANNTFVDRHNRGSETIIQLSPHGRFSDAYALTPAGSPFRLHGKVGVRDGRHVLVGSFNLDPRSYSTNLESATEVRNCPALAEDLESEFDRLRRVYVDDAQSGRVPPTEPPSFLAKVIAIIGINFL